MFTQFRKFPQYCVGWLGKKYSFRHDWSLKYPFMVVKPLIYLLWHFCCNWMFFCRYYLIFLFKSSAICTIFQDPGSPRSKPLATELSLIMLHKLFIPIHILTLLKVSSVTNHSYLQKIKTFNFFSFQFLWIPIFFHILDTFPFLDNFQPQAKS
jgi:hypothetical protein